MDNTMSASKEKNAEVLRYLQDNEIKNKSCDMAHPFAFISYAHDDDVTVIRRVFSELFDSGFNLWIDVANLPVDGHTWEKAAMDALVSENCKLLIFFRSGKSLVKSTIQREIQNFSSVEGRTGADIITVDLSKEGDPHTTPFMESLKGKDDQKYNICKAICAVVSSHCNALRYHLDYDDVNDFLGALIGELNKHSFRQKFSMQEKVEFILDGTFHVNLNSEQERVMKRYRCLLKECMSDPTAKRSLLIIGGPGVGKTVLAMMMLNEYVRMKKGRKDDIPEVEEIKIHLISKNMAPRETYRGVLNSRKEDADRIKDKKESQRYKKLLCLSDKVFCSAQGLEDRYKDENQVDVIVVDEAHRLEQYAQYEKNRENKKSQPEAVAKVARLSVFFCDPEQMVTFSDYGTLDNLKHACAHDHAQNSRYFIERLETQMRCGGADSYMEWIDCLLQMDDHDEPEAIGKAKPYDLRVFDDPSKMFEEIVKKNEQDGPARVLAGMCWPWPKESQSRADVYDVIMPEYKFEKSWNLDYAGKKNKNYASDKDSVKQIGCIHTVQGLEFTYVGVIIGMDMGFKDNRIVTREKVEDYANRINGEIQGEKSEYSNAKLLTGSGVLEKKYKELEKSASKAKTKEEYYELMSEAARIKEEYKTKCHNILRNVYRVLLTRGTKGCYIFCCDPLLQEYMKEQVQRFNDSEI